MHPIVRFPSFKTFIRDLELIERIRNDGNTITFSTQRLQLLQLLFTVHVLLNERFEKEAIKIAPVDFETVIKVDTHVHSAAAVHAQHLLRFMKEKLKSKPEEVVSISNGREITLSELMKNAGLHPRILTVSTMDMKASGIFQRFDKLRNANRPFGVEDLRTVFLRKDNYIRGRYFAELFKDQLERIEKYRFTMTEYRTSLHGRTRDDWNALAHWVLDNNVRSSCNRWLVQVPHDYDQFKKNGEIECFQDMLDNIFLPLFEVTIDPSCNPTLHEVLRDISGFDSVCNEGEAFEPMITSYPFTPTLIYRPELYVCLHS